jgi:hypothetical protein
VISASSARDGGLHPQVIAAPPRAKPRISRSRIESAEQAEAAEEIIRIS